MKESNQFRMKVLWIFNYHWFILYQFLFNIEFHWDHQPRDNILNTLSSMKTNNAQPVDLSAPVSCRRRIHTRSELKRHTARVERACRTSTARSLKGCRELSDSGSTQLLVGCSRSKHLSLREFVGKICWELERQKFKIRIESMAPHLA